MTEPNFAPPSGPVFTEEEIEAEYAGEVYGLDDEQPLNEYQHDDAAEIDTDIYEDDEPAPGGPRMG